jgi:hypothetical protein
MPIQLVPKPPAGNANIDPFEVILLGCHTTKQKIGMLLQVKFFLHEQGIDNAGITKVFFPLIGPHGHPITHFRDGTPVAGYRAEIESPYHCAADDYDRCPSPPAYRPF